MQVPPPGTVGEESDSNAPNAMYNNNSTDASIALAAHTLADQLRPFVPQNTLDATHIADLQLAICRKLRELLPSNKELLQTAQEQNWFPILLSWLNLHDRPAVQVEALLALTNIAELCASTQISSTTNKWTEAVEAAQSKFVAAAASSSSSATSKYPSVPFPPLSFSQTCSPEAVAAFDASLTNTLVGESSGGKRITIPSGINFSSLAPPPGGAHTAVPSNSFLPPPTPVTAPAFPQHLSASSQHLLLRHADAIPTLISLLSSSDRQVYEQAAWILGSIAAGDAPGAASTGGSSADHRDSSSTTAPSASASATTKAVSARDVILAAGVMSQLIRCLELHATNLSLQRIGSWTLSNLVDGIFQTSSHKNSMSNNNNGSSSGKSDYSSSDEIDMSILLPVLRRLLSMADSEVLGYTCWTLSHLCDGPSSHIAAVVTSSDPNAPAGGLVPRLVELLSHPSWRVTKPALRTIGNIVCAECTDDNHSSNSATDYTEVILDFHAVPKLKDLVTHSNREIQKEACWTLSNIAAGTVDQIQAVIDSGAIPPLVQLVKDKKTDQEVRSEACWVVLNATSCGSDAQIEVLVDEGCVSVLGVLLSEASMVLMALEGLERVLQVEETREMIRREQGDPIATPTLVSAALIEKARESHNSSVTKRAERIWKQHFVSCALCKKSFSKHRTADASFCEECKCHVCSNCNCKIYHLDYQEELWAATEEKTEAKKNAKKSRNKKKKAKLKEKKAKQQEEEVKESPTTHDLLKVGSEKDVTSPRSRDSVSESSEKEEPKKSKDDKSPSPSPSLDDDDETMQIDFVLYLQQTGSIIALARLMDALENDDYDDELNDYERKMIREQQLMREQATNSAH